jgi:anti-sigma B factor antagonist
MKVKTTRLGVAAYLAPDGALVEESLTSLADAVRQQRESGTTDVVIDLRRVSFLDSAALEFVLDLASSLRDAGGSLRLAGPSQVTRDVLAITRVDQSVSVYDDIESAGRSFL